MEGQLSEYPLAELVREIGAQKMSGALRLQRERAKAAIYFEDGRLIFAASNLRPHRLRECLKRAGLGDALPAIVSESSDDQLAKALIESGLTNETLTNIRNHQAAAVLRTALLWTNGIWEFDLRVRLANDLRVSVDVQRLLLECARHLPADFVGSRFDQATGITYLNSANGETANLLPSEVLVLARAKSAVGLRALTAIGNLSEPDCLRAVYALSLSGLLQRSEWSPIFGRQPAKPSQKISPRQLTTVIGDKKTAQANEAADLQALLARLHGARDHYEVLDVGRLADEDEIKRAYHHLARNYHPDRFHQSGPELRARVDSAFARIAQAYETLSEVALRAAYDAKLKPSASTGAPKRAETTTRPPKKIESDEDGSGPSNAERAESSFRAGLAALEGNQRELAIRLLAEAAMLAPREARYRAQYGHALIGMANTKRVAESELQAAISLEPGNASHRVMLAELYEKLGLRRRARGELDRALTADPKNEAARKMLASIKSKN